MSVTRNFSTGLTSPVLPRRPYTHEGRVDPTLVRHLCVFCFDLFPFTLRVVTLYFTSVLTQNVIFWTYVISGHVSELFPTFKPKFDIKDSSLTLDTHVQCCV